MHRLNALNLIILYIILSLIGVNSTQASIEEPDPLCSTKSLLYPNREHELEIIKSIVKNHENDEFRILFLCTGNACRSQMAQGWMQHLGDKSVKVESAGIEAHGVNPKAVKTMSLLGIDISHQTSKILKNEMLEWADLLITVCGDADERCPLATTNIAKLHWPLKDPAKALGDDEQVLRIFNDVSLEIKQYVVNLIGVLVETQHIKE